MNPLSSLLDLLFPKKSINGEEGAWITDNEIRSMKLFPVRFHRDLLRRRGLTALDCLIAAGSYRTTPELKQAIRTFKYHRIPALHEPLAKLMINALPGLLLHPTNRRGEKIAPVVCPVPLHFIRKFWRGFNQSELLARDLAQAKGWPLQHLLRRWRPTGHQTKRTRVRRMQALSGAFTFAGEQYAPRYVILVDDVSTTGATLDECAKALKNAGVRYVYGMVVGHG